MKKNKKKKFSDIQKNSFNEYAKSFQLQKRKVIMNKAIQYEIDTIIACMPDIQGATVLDVGCGIGTLLLSLCKKAKTVTGIDMSEESIHFVNQKAKLLRLHNYKAVCGDIYNYSSRNRFDYILVVNVVHHVPHPDKFFSKIKSILKPNGKIILFENNPLNVLFYPLFLILGCLKIHLNKEFFQSTLYSLRSYVKKSRLKIISLERYAFFPTFLYNYSPFFISLNRFLNTIPIINIFCAFHIIICEKKRT